MGERKTNMGVKKQPNLWNAKKTTKKRLKNYEQKTKFFFF